MLTMKKTTPTKIELVPGKLYKHNAQRLNIWYRPSPNWKVFLGKVIDLGVTSKDPINFNREKHVVPVGRPIMYLGCITYLEPGNQADGTENARFPLPVFLDGEVVVTPCSGLMTKFFNGADIELAC